MKIQTSRQEYIRTFIAIYICVLNCFCTTFKRVTVGLGTTATYCQQIILKSALLDIERWSTLKKRLYLGLLCLRCEILELFPQLPCCLCLRVRASKHCQEGAKRTTNKRTSSKNSPTKFQKILKKTSAIYLGMVQGLWSQFLSLASLRR